MSVFLFTRWFSAVEAHGVVFITHDCTPDINNWMSSNILQLNSSKPKVLIIGQGHSYNWFHHSLEDLSQALVQKSKLDLSHACQIVLRAWYRLVFFFFINLDEVMLGRGDTEKLIQNFISSCLCYCNTHWMHNYHDNQFKVPLRGAGWGLECHLTLLPGLASLHRLPVKF